MPTPRSPLEKSSGHSRRPSWPSRSSSDKSSSNTKHGMKSDRSRTQPEAVAATTVARSSPSGRGSMENTKLGASGADVGGGDPSTTATSTGPDGGDTLDDVSRLRAALDAQMQLKQSRDRLKKQMGVDDGRDTAAITSPAGKSRVSPIHEEETLPSLDDALPRSSLTTVSSESAHTIRGVYTPSLPLGTPSYPFPQMKTPRSSSYIGHRPFTALSPTIAPAPTISTAESHARDQVLSGPNTPMSPTQFQGFSPLSERDDVKFPRPDLYELSLSLSAEPGLDSWWTTVSEIMKDIYKADRVTLSVPADSTDIENVPWGQKATFNAQEEDVLSLAYLGRNSNHESDATGKSSTSGEADESAQNITPARPSRPAMPRGHSFAAFEDVKRSMQATPGESVRAVPLRPLATSRAKSFVSIRPDTQVRSVSLESADEVPNPSIQARVDDKRQSLTWGETGPASRRYHGRVFPVLQALDYEADPLIDSSGVMRVMDRAGLVTLTRDYPYLASPPAEPSKEDKLVTHIQYSKESGKLGKARPDLGARLSSSASGTSSRRSGRSARSGQSEKGKAIPATRHLEESTPPVPRYEEYEQIPPSPWSQSPAPSPAVRNETSENPFFANTSAVEESFDPSADTPDYSQAQNVEAIGVDQSWTVLHVPLYHPLLSRPVQTFRLDTAVLESRSGRRKDSTQLPSIPDTAKLHGNEPGRDKRIPIAILSILSPVIPYVSSLRHSLQHLAPHLATSFAMCRHYTNLETELAGIIRKRPHTIGFGAIATTLTGEVGYQGDAPRRSMAGSMTSPSEYSGFSKSTHASPAVTPGWEPGSTGFNGSKRYAAESPSAGLGEGYFATRPGVTKREPPEKPKVRRSPRGSPPAESRATTSAPRDETGTVEDSDADPGSEISAGKTEIEGSSSSGTSGDRLKETRFAPGIFPDEAGSLDSSPAQSFHDASPYIARHGSRNTLSANTATERQHTLLHSYGADFGNTFQSLPATTAPTKKVNLPPSGLPGLMNPKDMPPPSDRLKGLMLDSLPVQVFVALPQTGEVVWVNSRYLTYRGQTVSDLFGDPWASIHPEERAEYLKGWTHAVKTGEPFSMQVRIRRFDGTYRWFFTRAVGSKDSRGVIVQWYGSHMDIHDQHVAEVKAARQEEIEASEAKHKQLANLIPQIIFSATEDEGVTFANEQWLSYTGQPFDEAMGLGFMDHIHPEDIAKCHIPGGARSPLRPQAYREPSKDHTISSKSSSKSSLVSDAQSENTIKGVYPSISRQNSSSDESTYEMVVADLTELAKTGVVKISTDSAGRLSYTTEVRIRNSKGEYRWHLVSCVQVENIGITKADGSWFGACTDINDHKLLERKLKEAMESKSKFLSNMSHEIRTPLIGISGMVNFLQDTPLTDEQTDYCNTIQSSASSLLNIINDILDLSKVEAGMMTLSMQWFYPRSLVEEVNEMVSTLAITKRLELNYMVDTDVPEVVKGDKFRIRQVLLNVIGNAIKFTSQGEVFSRCRVHGGVTPDEGSIMLEYSIVDTGSGFTKEDAELMFKPFSQIDGSSTRQHGGTGLGLVISRQLVELHGGTMIGTSIPGQGSTFTFTAKFALPSTTDHPLSPIGAVNTALLTPDVSKTFVPAKAMKQAGGNPLLANRIMQSPFPQTQSPRSETSHQSPGVASSSSSEAPSLHSVRSRTTTHRSSSSSISHNLEPFNEAAISIQAPLQMKLAIPEKRGLSISDSPQTLDVSDEEAPKVQLRSADAKHFRPLIYSILLICPQKHSREATTQHIETTLPKDVPHQMTAFASVEEAEKLILGDDPVIFTHIVLNLPSSEEINNLIHIILGSLTIPQTSIVILSDPKQRQDVIKAATEYNFDQLAYDDRINFVYKPVKPSRFATIFDPDRERTTSTDRNRSSAQQQVASQKQNYLDVGQKLGNRGLRILLVEDNKINQKVMLKYFSKVDITVELAFDGVDCIEKVTSKDHGFYSLILCDLHMPRKDGYQTCREIRAWERKEQLPHMPIIALSANVMDNVVDRCTSVGFDSYVTKPVDFQELSSAMADLLLNGDDQTARRGNLRRKA